MTAGKIEASALRTWALVLGFLVALLVVMAGVAFVMGRLAGPGGAHHVNQVTKAQAAEGRH